MAMVLRVRHMVNKRFYIIWSFVCSMLYATEGECSSPVPVMEETVAEVLSSLEAVCVVDAKPSVIEGVIEDVFIPHVDANLITKQILGRRYWEESTPKERAELEVLLKGLITHHYAEAFNCKQLKNKMEFYPMRGEIKKYARVESSIEVNGQEPVHLRYAVRCVDGNWRIYDLVVNGLSLGQTYRSQFNSILKKGGAAELVAYLTSKMNKGDDELSTN